MNIVIDIEFYHQAKKEDLGAIKQIGAFKFTDDYKIIDVFEMTVTKYTRLNLVKTLFNAFMSDVSTVFVWDQANDRRVLENELDVEFADFSLIDVQTYFKQVNLASLNSISSALRYDSEGRHNALIDAEFTFDVIKHFNLANDISRQTLSSLVEVLKANGSLTTAEETKPAPKKEKKKQANYRLFSPGSMRKVNEEYYSINSESALDSIIETIARKQFPIMVDGDVAIEPNLERLITNNADIVFSNTKKFKSIARKFSDKLIIVVDESNSKQPYLAAFVSRDAFKKFANIK